MIRFRVPSRAGRIAACGAAALLAVPALSSGANAAGTSLPTISPQPFDGIITHFPNTFTSPKGLVFIPAAR